MRNHLKSLTCTLLLAGSLAFMAAPVRGADYPNPDSEVKLRTNADGFTLHVLVVNLLEENTVIELTNLEDDVYFSKAIRKHNGFSQNLHLQRLPEGRYVLRVKQADKELSQVVVVTDTGLLLSQVIEE